MFNPVLTDDTLFIVDHKENCVNGTFLEAGTSDVAPANILVAQSLNRINVKLAINQRFVCAASESSSLFAYRTATRVANKSRSRETERRGAVFHLLECGFLSSTRNARGSMLRWCTKPQMEVVEKTRRLRYTRRFMTPVISRRFTALFYTRYARTRACDVTQLLVEKAVFSCPAYERG